MMKLNRKYLLVASVLILLGVIVGVTATHAAYQQAERQLDLRNHYNVNVFIEARHPDGEVFYTYQTHNLITNIGVTFLQVQAAGTPAVKAATYIGLTTDTTAPAYTDTTLTAELSISGITRAAGTYTAGTAASGDVTWTVTKTFTATGAHTAVDKAGLWTDAQGSGTLFAEATFASVNLQNGDTLSITWTVAATN
jgi:hypothetical protein